MEGRANQLPEKTRLLNDLNKKLEIAEAGKLKEIATLQARLANERSLTNIIVDVVRQYNTGVDLSGLHQEYAAYAEDAGVLTGSPVSDEELSKIQNAFIDINAFLKKTEQEINDRLKLSAGEINTALVNLKVIQTKIEQQLNTKITELQKKGLTGNLAELTTLIKSKSSLAEEIGRITGQKTQLEKLRKERKQHLDELSNVRDSITSRRKAPTQLNQC